MTTWSRSVLWAVLFWLAGCPSARAFHVCPTVSDDTPAGPVVTVTSAKALKARTKLLVAIGKGHQVPPGLVRQLGDEYGRDVRSVCANDADQCRQLLLSNRQRTVAAAFGANPACLPEGTTLAGTLAPVISLTDAGPATTWYLQPDDGSRHVRLSVARDIQPQLVQGHATIRGHRLVNDLYVAADGGALQASPASDLGQPSVPPPGPARVAVIGTSFTDSSATQSLDQLTADVARLAAYYSETAQGRFSLATQTATVTIPTTNPCDPFASAQAVITALGWAIDWRQVDVIASTTQLTTCAFGGISNVGFNANLLLPDGTRRGFGVNLDREGVLHVLAHELGHALGLLHAGEVSGFDASGTFPPGDLYVPNLTAEEYGNGWETMGSPYVGPLGCEHQGLLQWLTSSEALTDPAPGTYRLTPFSLAGGLRCLYFHLGDLFTASVQYRTNSTPWDAAVGEPYGVYVSSSGHYGGREDIRRPFGRTDARLLVGDRITTPTGLDLSLDAQDATSATITVHATGTPDVGLPNALIHSPASGAGVSGFVTLDIEATDNVAVARVDCWLTTSTGQRVQIGADDAAPWVCGFDSTLYPDGQSSLSVRAIDLIGNAGMSTVRVYLANNTPPPDTLAVTVDSRPTSPAPTDQPYRICAHCLRQGVVAPCGIWLQMQPLARYGQIDPATGCGTMAAPFPNGATTNVFVLASVDGLEAPAVVWSTLFLDPTGSTTSTTTTTPPTSTTLGSTTTSTLKPTTTSTSSSSTSSSTSTSSTTAKPTTTTLKSTTTTTTSSTTSTTAPCRLRSDSCVMNGVKQPQLCCSGRCGGAKRCK